MAKRKISWTTRLKLRQNALEAVKKWKKMSHKARVMSRRKKYYSWGWEGKSPVSYTHLTLPTIYSV